MVRLSSLLTWTALGTLLTNNTSRVIYSLPIAGYVILYSDYFQSLFKFSSVTSTSWGFLSFWQRINFIYVGSLGLLFALGCWWWFAPPLLRGKRNLQHFAGDIAAARDRSAVLEIAKSEPFTLHLDEVEKVIGKTHRHAFEQSVGAIELRAYKLGEGAGEWEDRIPTMLGLYFLWQDVTKPFVRVFIAAVAYISYGFILLPAVDLFLRVLGTHYHRLFS